MSGFALCVREVIRSELRAAGITVSSVTTAPPPAAAEQPPRVRRAAAPAQTEAQEEEETEQEEETEEPEKQVVSIGGGRSGARAALKPVGSTKPDEEDVESVQIDVDSLPTMSRNQLKPIAETLGIDTAGMKAEVMREKILEAAKAKGMMGPRETEEEEETEEGGDESETELQAIADDTSKDFDERKAAAGKLEAEEFPESSLDEMVGFFDENSKHKDVKAHFKAMGCDEDCFNCVAYFQNKCFAKFNQE